MKYAIATICDQTWVYVDEQGGETVEHAKAKLWDDVQTASHEVSTLSAKLTLNIHDSNYAYTNEDIIQLVAYWIEVVEDELEFCAREDTW